jgi:hypothetical protein
VVKIILQFCKENTLVESLNALQVGAICVSVFAPRWCNRAQRRLALPRRTNAR